MSHQPTEEELRAAYEAEIKRLRVDDVLLQTVVSLVNLGGRKAGLAPGSEDERDLGQLRTSIDAATALLPFVEQQLGPDAAQVRNALSQLQMAYAQASAQAPGGGEQPEGGPGGPAGGGQAPGGGRQPPEGQQPPQRPPSSGRLWVPGQ